MFSLNNKIALVTGASGGIGADIARHFAANGATVILSGTNTEKLNSVLASLLPAKTGTHTIITANLRDPEALAKLAKEAEELHGHIDILVNNAGLTKDGLLMRMKDEDWLDVLEVNLTGAFRLSRAVIKGMMKNRTGRIINIASVVGVMGNAGQTNYVASKAGLIGFSKALAQEVASRGITVNTIAPGFISTPMTEKLNEAQKNAMLARIPLGVFGTGEDIAAAALYLASDGAKYVTGQTLHVNGGMVMV
jgi:3-oxoacyl-[acyl-carrier protein] reductase